MIGSGAFFATLLLSSAAAAQANAPVLPPGAGGSTLAAPKPAPDRSIASTPTVIRPGNPDPGMAIAPQTAGTQAAIPPSRVK